VRAEGAAVGMCPFGAAAKTRGASGDSKHHIAKELPHSLDVGLRGPVARSHVRPKQAIYEPHVLVPYLACVSMRWGEVWEAEEGGDGEEQGERVAQRANTD